MKATLLLLAGLASLMGAPLEPMAAIDFGPALHLNNKHRGLAIWMLSACPKGPMVVGGPPSIMTTTVARSDRTGSAIESFDLRVLSGGGALFAALPDGSFWFATRWTGSDFPAPPITPGIIDASALPRGTTRPGPLNYDLYTRDGRYLKSFRLVAALTASIHPANLPLSLAGSSDEIVIIYDNLIRAGHLSGGDFVTDRDWHVNGPHLVFPLDHDRFAVVNRMSGEFAIIDPSTPATQTIAVPFKSVSRRDRLPVTAANGSIWFLVNGATGNTRDLVQFAVDGSIVSRNTLLLARASEPRKIAISGRDVYLAGIGSTVYRYELP